MSYGKDVLALQIPTAGKSLELAQENLENKAGSFLRVTQERNEFFTDQTKKIRNKGDKSKVLTLLNNIGHAYKSEGKVDSAFTYFRRALRHNDSTMLPEQSITLTNIGFCFLEHLDNEDSAFYYLNQANEIYLKSDNKRSLRKNLEKTGSWYTSQGQIPKALNFYDQALMS